MSHPPSPSEGKPSFEHRLRWRLFQWQTLLGHPGIAAVALIAALILFQLGVIWPMKTSATKRHVSALQKQQQQTQQLNTLSTSMSTPQGVDLPKASQLMTQLEAAYALLGHYGFSVKAATYQQTVMEKDKLQRVVVDAPFIGTYPRFHQALVALSQEPGVRIDAISIERRTINTDITTLRLRFSLLGVTE